MFAPGNEAAAGVIGNANVTLGNDVASLDLSNPLVQQEIKKTLDEFSVPVISAWDQHFFSTQVGSQNLTPNLKLSSKSHVDVTWHIISDDNYSMIQINHDGIPIDDDVQKCITVTNIL